MNRLDLLYDEIKSHAFLRFLDNPKKLAFYGAGVVCEWLLENAKAYNLPISCIVDADKTGNMQGIPIIKKEEFFSNSESKFGDYKFLITTKDYVYAIGKELLSRGIDQNDIYVPDRQCLINGLGLPDFVLAHAYFAVLDLVVYKEHYYNVYNHLIDENSKTIFLAILKFRVYGRYELDKELYAPDVSYFHTGYLKLGTKECFCDVGAYTGDSIIDFLMKTHHDYDRIYAVEGNAQSCEKLKKKLDIEFQKGRIEVFNVGAGSKRETIVYNGYRGGIGEDRLNIYTLDELLKGKKVTLIKMDIEGMEMQALEGAKEIIMTQKPKLAICVYHLIRDIWQIQEKLMQFVPEYQFCLEQPVHVSMSETVLYAFVGGQSES